MSESRRSGEGPPESPQHPASNDDGPGAEEATWYVYDRHASLLHVTANLEMAEAWARSHWDVVEIADREEVAANDFYYLLLAAPSESGFRARDFQARIMRRDRVVALGRDPDAAPTDPD